MERVVGQVEDVQGAEGGEDLRVGRGEPVACEGEPPQAARLPGEHGRGECLQRVAAQVEGGEGSVGGEERRGEGGEAGVREGEPRQLAARVGGEGAAGVLLEEGAERVRAQVQLLQARQVLEGPGRQAAQLVVGEVQRVQASEAAQGRRAHVADAVRLQVEPAHLPPPVVRKPQQAVVRQVDGAERGATERPCRDVVDGVGAQVDDLQGVRVGEGGGGDARDDVVARVELLQAQQALDEVKLRDAVGVDVQAL